MKPKNGYNKWAKFYDYIENKMPIGKFKKEAVSHLRGKVLEVGIGSGANLKFYSKDVEVIGLDFSKEMLSLAEKKIEKLNLKNITLVEMNIEDIQFPNNSFDSVLSTCVFCTVPNPKKGLEEVYRVLKPGGYGVFLEHMKSKNSFINFFLWIFNFLTINILGTSLLRETEKTIRMIGFKEVKVKNLMMKDVLRLIIVKK